MKLYKTSNGFVLQKADDFHRLEEESWDELINRDDLYAFLSEKSGGLKPSAEARRSATEAVLAPIGTQELWASGVTYHSSQLARMEEAEEAGGGDFYRRVYHADRPELFFKSTAGRVLGPQQKVRIRADSTWNVPEPELTLCVSSSGKIVGYTIGNDMSSRSIEGKNPLYLPQAKTYDGSAALGPCLYVSEKPFDREAFIRLGVSRHGHQVFSGQTQIKLMKRTFEDLVGYLFREMSFRTGVFLMTGTGIVPTAEFTLQPGDEIEITIDSIGTLVNTVA